jgi:hypothetical protein
MRTAARRPAANRRIACRYRLTVMEAWRTILKDLFDPYRPELYYMRGPGPKWREKHSPAYAMVEPARGEYVRVRI